MVSKSQIVLYIYSELINHKEIRLDEIVEKFDISIRTFRRYIAEINAYLSNNFRNQNVSYDQFKNSYILK